MRADEAVLDDIIKDGSVDVEEWPELLGRLIERLDNIARNSFPKAKIPVTPPDVDVVSVAPSQATTIPTISAEPSQLTEPSSTQDTTGNISPPSFSQDESSSSPKMPPLPVVPVPPSPPPVPFVTTEEPTPPPAGTLDPEDEALLASLTNILTTQFEVAPPYTVQRLSELIRYPNTHYKSLSKYLRAIQRVLSVSSPVTAFPLPPSAVDSMPNGSTTVTASFNLGSDESLGGALLSPIPWLTESLLTEGTEAVNGVSQGELLRQEQELNIVPATQASGPPEGPPALGPEDVGPQPEGTVFPDPPATLEEARSPKPSPVEGEEEMGDASDGTEKVAKGEKDEGGEEGEADKQREGEEEEKEEKKNEKEKEKADEKDEAEEEKAEDKKDDMDVDTKDPELSKEDTGTETKDESSEMMQLDTPIPNTKTTPPATATKPEGEDDGTIS